MKIDVSIVRCKTKYTARTVPDISFYENETNGIKVNEIAKATSLLLSMYIRKCRLHKRTLG